jgi:hypothetical protein
VDDGARGGLAGGDVIAASFNLEVGGQIGEVPESDVIDDLEGVFGSGSDLNFELLVRFPDLGDANESALDVRPGLKLILPFLFEFKHLAVVYRQCRGIPVFEARRDRRMHGAR